MDIEWQLHRITTLRDKYRYIYISTKFEGNVNSCPLQLIAMKNNKKWECQNGKKEIDN